MQNIKKISTLGIIILSLIVLAGCAGPQKQSSTGLDASKATDTGVPETKAPENNSSASSNQGMSSKNNQTNNQTNSMEQTNLDYVKNYTGAILKTNMGDIEVKFFADSAPETVNNFLKLADQKFYDGVKFHRVIKGFMIQGGDPLSKDDAQKNSWGTGGPGYKFADELSGKETYPQGTLAMANSGPNTNGSQFFIVTASPQAPLPPSYTVFGQVKSGLDVALKIENVKTTGSYGSPADQPLEDVMINGIELKAK
jgi:cyclophilin family peptidyl-prolyl cis-trans isomerase